MPWVQKEEDLNANPQVQTDQRGTMAIVPEAPLALFVNMPFLQFQNPNTAINNPADDVVYVVTEENGVLTVDTVPLIVNAPPCPAGPVAPKAVAKAGQAGRANSVHRAGVTAGLLVTSALLLLHGLNAPPDDA